MDNKKLISVRLSEKDLQAIDKRCKLNGYRKRSDYICKAVSFMAWAIDNCEEEAVMKFWPEFGDVVDKFEFKFHRKHS